jgi:hypothetical protein
MGTRLRARTRRRPRTPQHPKRLYAQNPLLGQVCRSRAHIQHRLEAVSRSDPWATADRRGTRKAERRPRGDAAPRRSGDFNLAPLRTSTRTCT